MKNSQLNAVQESITQNLLRQSRNFIAFLDIDEIEYNVLKLREAFPSNFLHTFATKANSLKKVLRIFKQNGIGCEVASPGELLQADLLGFKNSTVVFDSPSKSAEDIQFALSRGYALNIDNFQEFDVVREIHNQSNGESTIGFRINPQIGSGSIESTSTATKTSKFGVALLDKGNRDKIIQTYIDHKWLSAIHCHVGSQGCPPELFYKGIRITLDLVNEINSKIGYQQINVVNIGGGLPVNFVDDQTTPTYQDYSAGLKNVCPELFTEQFKVITEFGRSLIAKAGMMVGFIDYVKQSGGRHISMTQMGVQSAVRTIYDPEKWPLRIKILDQSGKLKSAPLVEQDIAGPCCFAGDLLAQKTNLPKTEKGDLAAVLDVGAYYFSTHYFYNCMPAPTVYGYRKNQDREIEFELFRKEKSLEETLDFFNE